MPLTVLNESPVVHYAANVLTNLLYCYSIHVNRVCSWIEGLVEFVSRLCGGQRWVQSVNTYSREHVQSVATYSRWPRTVGGHVQSVATYSRSTRTVTGHVQYSMSTRTVCRRVQSVATYVDKCCR